MNSLIKWLSQEYDIVLLDSPAMLALSETTFLASIVDGVILVARRNYIKEEAVKETCRQLADIKVHIVGLVVNEAEQTGTYYYYGHR
jgi:Mrp family chromosome partitioning ATPase